MQIQSIEVSKERGMDPELGPHPKVMLTVSFKYLATEKEANTVAEMLAAGKEPPVRFWEAIDFGDAGVIPDDIQFEDPGAHLCPTHGQPMVETKCSPECRDHWVCVCTYGGTGASVG